MYYLLIIQGRLITVLVSDLGTLSVKSEQRICVMMTVSSGYVSTVYILHLLLDGHASVTLTAEFSGISSHRSCSK